MTAKLVVVSVFTALAIAAVGVGVFFFLMLGMNGMTERQAAPVFVGYFILGLFTLVAAAAASAWGAGYVTRRAGWSLWVTGPLAVFVVSAAGGALLFLGSIVLLAVLVETPKRPPARRSGGTPPAPPSAPTATGERNRVAE